jgi:predicted O-methyltransferase YrrM
MRAHPATRLAEIPLELPTAAAPADVVALIADARQRIEKLENTSRAAMPAFVPSDFDLAYQALAAIEKAHLAAGHRFLEWGSGIGVVACLATQLGFDAVGIEIEPPLVEIAESLATTHRLNTQFVCGSFLPDGAEVRLELPDDFAWMTTTGSAAYDELDLAPDDFDIVFAYPWPGEEQVIFDLFADHAATGALLLTYHGLEGIRLQRKRGR